MGFLRRRPPLETELAAQHTRKDLLSKQLTTVEGKIGEAVAARQVRLLEAADLEVPNEHSPLVERLRDERAAVLTAISTIDQRIAESESRLAAERDRSKREAAARELNGVTDELTKLADDYAAVVSRLPAMLAGVIDKLPQAVVSKSHTEMFANEVLAALRMVVSESRSHAAQIVSGNAQICESAAQQPANPPAPAIVERRQIFLLAASRWEENGETICNGPHCTASPPAPIARAAIEFGHALEAGSDLAVTLQMRSPPNYSVFLAADCVDISRPKELSRPPGSQTAAPPPVHSAFVGRPRIGTAVAR
jgi:hypothetical protein